MNYKLELKQIVEFPRCRIYRDFIQTLITTKSIRTTGGSFLFYYLVLCSYANYRTDAQGCGPQVGRNHHVQVLRNREGWQGRQHERRFPRP